MIRTRLVQSISRFTSLAIHSNCNNLFNIRHSSSMVGKFTAVERGAPNSKSFRVYFSKFLIEK